MPDLRLTWKCDGCGTIEVVHARSRHASDQIRHFKPRGWVGKRGPNRTSVAICARCVAMPAGGYTEDLGPFCSQCGGDRGRREPADADGYGCMENIHHTEKPTP